MGIKNEQVKAGYFKDLPEDMKKSVMEIHKILVEKVREEFNDDKFSNINNKPWAKNMVNEFLAMPTDTSEIGSFKVYKKGKRFRMCIQISGHVQNNRSNEYEELFHGMIRNAHIAVRSQIRRKYDLTLECESEHGELYEDFNLWTKQKTAKEMWEKLTESQIVVENTNIFTFSGDIDDLPCHLKEDINAHNELISNRINEHFNCKYDSTPIGEIYIKESNGNLYGSITLTPILSIKSENGLELVYESLVNQFDHDNPTKHLELIYDNYGTHFEMSLDPIYSYKLLTWMESNDNMINVSYNEETTEDVKSIKNDNEAKRTMKTLSQNIINSYENDEKYSVSQYTADIYANIINKFFIADWAHGYRKVSIKLYTDKMAKNNNLSFKIPTITQDFVAHYLEGRESFNGFLHRVPEIKIMMDPHIFQTLKDANASLSFFKSAIVYYDKGLQSAADKLMGAYTKLNQDLKRLISTSKLSGLVTVPLYMLTSFDNIDMNKNDNFKISKENIDAIKKFINNIYSKYANPEKEKKQVIADLNEVIKTFKENCEFDDNLKNCINFIEDVNRYYNHEYDNELQKYHEEAFNKCIDYEWNRNQKNVKYLQEAFFVKKLKKIPRDLIPYISVEAEAIRDTNDKMMIASYCMSKIEIVEWYIELLEVGSKKYIVPHSKPYLEDMRTQLLACYRKIMAVRITPPIERKDRPIIDIKYPKGYEG